MSQNQHSGDGDRSFNRPPRARTDVERDQLQYFDRQRQDVQPQNMTTQPLPNPGTSQFVGSYAGVNPTSTSSTSQFGAMPNIYSSAPLMTSSQPPMSASMHPISNPAAPPMHPSYGSWTNNMGYGGSSAQTSSTYAYGQQQSTQAMRRMSNPQPTQWSPGQTGATGPYQSALIPPTMTTANSRSAAQSGTQSVSPSTLLLPPPITPQRPSRGTPRTDPGRSQNISSPFSSQGQSPVSHGGSRRTRRRTRVQTPYDRPIPDSTSQEPFKWRSGMKEKKITADMSEEEKQAALDYNMRLGEAKKAHTREQNRVSAQKSRAKKVELLARTEERAEELDQELRQARQQIAALELRVQQTSNHNLQLRAENDALQYRLAVMEENMRGLPPIRNPFATLPRVEAPSQDPSPLATQAQATQTEVAAQTQPAQDQVDFDNSLTAANTTLSDLGLPLINPTLWDQLPTTNDPQDPAPQIQDPNTLVSDAQQDDTYEWLDNLIQPTAAPDTDQQSGDPSNQGAQGAQ
ncbi:hypothetical protein F4776DRAFT_663988 [Hypoxylon sp. NC0597]|nr:hypothetical protein F4776DRAFT_663988 [Hypoxylon sp. NC0597]